MCCEAAMRALVPVAVEMPLQGRKRRRSERHQVIELLLARTIPLLVCVPQICESAQLGYAISLADSRPPLTRDSCRKQVTGAEAHPQMISLICRTGTNDQSG